VIGRARIVADVNKVLYYWVQSANSVTHQKKDFSFHHDSFIAGLPNFYEALMRGITPAKSYYVITGSYRSEEHAPDVGEHLCELRDDRRELAKALSFLSFPKRLFCGCLAFLRDCETFVYARTVHIKK
jgi:hypothetical protein